MPMSKASVAITSAAISAVISGIATFAGAWITATHGQISFPNPALEQQVSDLKKQLDNRSKLNGDFEWQWAGDNWIGSVTFQNLANGAMSATADIRSVKADPKNQFRTYGITQVGRSAIAGSATVSAQSTISLNLPVVLAPEFAKSHHVTATTVVLDAELHRVDAFAGRVRYLGDRPVPETGDIILVRYHSDVRKW